MQLLARLAQALLAVAILAVYGPAGQGVTATIIRGGQYGPSYTSSQCCEQLSAILWKQVTYPEDAEYQNQQRGANDAGYWTTQESSLQPSCRVTPTCAEEVSIAVSELSRMQCQFAIRGGGHTSWAGAANIHDGITIDLSAMNQVSVSRDQSVTSVGGGARWVDVYSKLDAMGLAVSGGRVYDVGVGGLTTGGGMSFFAPRYGFVCDNVVNYEIVLGSGRIIEVNQQDYPDLFKALKGGSNNFGIVTRFDLRTFNQGLLWGGFIAYPASVAPKMFQALEDFTTASGAGVDDYAAVINSYVFTGSENTTLIANAYSYTKEQPFPAIFHNFTELQPQLYNTLRTAPLTNFTIELGQGTPNGFRQLFATATFVNDKTIFSALFNISKTAFAPCQHAANFQVSFVLQPIPKSVTSRGAASGGNSLGLRPSHGNLVWLDLTVQWSDEKDDECIDNGANQLVNEGTAYAKARNMSHPYVYLNYAMKSQDPIASYGSANHNALRAASRKYDPEQVFQNLVPGGFKLWR